MVCYPGLPVQKSADSIRGPMAKTHSCLPYTHKSLTPSTKFGIQAASLRKMFGERVNEYLCKTPIHGLPYEIRIAKSNVCLGWVVEDRDVPNSERKSNHWSCLPPSEVLNGGMRTISHCAPYKTRKRTLEVNPQNNYSNAGTFSFP